MKSSGATGIPHLPFSSESFDFPRQTVTGSSTFEANILCRQLDCRKHCTHRFRIEYVTVHWDCLQTVKQACEHQGIDIEDLKDLVWVAAAWRRPASSLALTRLAVPPVSMLHTKHMEVIARSCGMPRLATLPPEILISIQRFSINATFWQAVQSLVFLHTVMALKPGPTLTVPFSQIEAWERDQPILPWSRLRLEPIVRITIDLHGIEKVERLPVMPRYTGECSNDRLYIVEEEGAFVSTTANIKVCLGPRVLIAVADNVPGWPHATDGQEYSHVSAALEYSLPILPHQCRRLSKLI